MGWHLRDGCLRKLRTELGLGSLGSDLGLGHERMKVKGRFGVRDLVATDAEGLDVRIEWTDGKVGRVRCSKDGGVVTFWGYIKPAVVKLQSLPLRAWRLAAG